MKTTAIEIKSAADFTEYTFNVLSTVSNLPIRTVSAVIEENFSNGFEVALFDGDCTPKYKTFTEEVDANTYAMKQILKIKNEYNN